jgi:hypothetical protein
MLCFVMIYMSKPDEDYEVIHYFFIMPEFVNSDIALGLFYHIS